MVRCHGRSLQIISMDPTAGWVAAWVQISLGKFMRVMGYDMSQFQNGVWGGTRTVWATIGGGVTSPSDEGSVDVEIVGDGVLPDSKWTHFPVGPLVGWRSSLPPLCTPSNHSKMVLIKGKMGRTLWKTPPMVEFAGCSTGEAALMTPCSRVSVRAMGQLKLQAPSLWSTRSSIASAWSSASTRRPLCVTVWLISLFPGTALQMLDGPEPVRLGSAGKKRNVHLLGTTHVDRPKATKILAKISSLKT